MQRSARVFAVENAQANVSPRFDVERTAAFTGTNVQHLRIRHPFTSAFSTMQLRFCFSRRWNDHTGYPRGLARFPPDGWTYRPTRVSFDTGHGRPWCRFAARDSEYIHASSLIPTNNSPWVLDTDHAQYLLLQAAAGTPGRRRPVGARVAAALTSPNCIGVIAWSRAAHDSILALCGRHGTTPPRVRVVYPAMTPPPPADEAAALSRVAPVLEALSPGSVRFLMVDGQIGVCARAGRKNVAAGLRCVRQLRREGLNVELVVVAPTERLGRRERWLHVLPRIPRQALWTLYGHTDVLLFLSRQDSFGYVILEAMHHGMCCVAVTGTSVPAVAEMLAHDETGLLLPARPSADHDALVAHARLTATNAELRQRIGAAARRQTLGAGRFSVQHRNAVLARIVGEWLHDAGQSAR